MKTVTAICLALITANSLAESPHRSDWFELLKPRVVSQNQDPRQQIFDLHAGIVHFSRLASLDPKLVAAIVLIESNADPCALSPKGAIGLMQLMPSTATQLGIADPFNPAQNLAAGTQYLRLMLDKAQGNYWQAAAMYNAGPGIRRLPVEKWPKETVRYVGQRLRLTLSRFQRQSWRTVVRSEIPLVNARLCTGRRPLLAQAKPGARTDRTDLMSLLVWWERSEK